MDNEQQTIDNGQNGQWTFIIENQTFDTNFWLLDIGQWAINYQHWTNKFCVMDNRQWTEWTMDRMDNGHLVLKIIFYSSPEQLPMF